MKVLKNVSNNSITIPPLKSSSFIDIFPPNNDSFFGALDSNLEAWLPGNFKELPRTEVVIYQLLEPLNNREVIDQISNETSILEKDIFSPMQIRHLVERQQKGEKILLNNGFSNLFFVTNPERKELYLLGVVYDDMVQKWVPYIYRLRNLYRAWSRGNQIFLRNKLS